jgi:hypothetical protein
MANSDFSHLTSKNRSALISSIYKEVSYYSETFCYRERAYLNKLSKIPQSIYWLSEGIDRLTAFTIVDSNYRFNVKNTEIVSFGHTISKKQGVMERLLKHIMDTYKENSLVTFCKKFVGDSLNLTTLGFEELNPEELKNTLPELADHKTSYFGVKNENLYSALIRKQYFVYLKVNEKDKTDLKWKM